MSEFRVPSAVSGAPTAAPFLPDEGLHAVLLISALLLSLRCVCVCRLAEELVQATQKSEQAADMASEIEDLRRR